VILKSQHNESFTIQRTIEQCPKGWRHLAEEALQVCIATGVPFTNQGVDDVAGLMLFRVEFADATPAQFDRILDALARIDELEDSTFWICRGCGSELGIRWRAWGDLYTYCQACKARLLPDGIFVYDAGKVLAAK
jgi:hypothetical protein